MQQFAVLRFLKPVRDQVQLITFFLQVIQHFRGIGEQDGAGGQQVQEKFAHLAGQFFIGNAEVKHSGWAPIHYAAFQDKPEMIRYLIAKGADKDAPAPNGDTALMLAARSGHDDAARALLHEDVDVNARNPDGQTALRIAKLGKHTAVVELLTRAGGVE